MANIPDIESGIKHIESIGSDESISASLAAYIKVLANAGNLASPLRGFNVDLKSKSLLMLFRDKNLAAAKSAAFAAAKARRMVMDYECYNSAMAWPDQLWYVLLSDHAEIRHWYAQYCLPALRGVYKKQLSFKVPGQVEHYTLQMCHTLLGNWDTLGEQSELALATEFGKRKSYRIDYEFFRALARGNQAEMEAALAQLFSPAVMKSRRTELGFGEIQRLMYAWGFIFAKLAWIHGYEVEVSNPWVPQELLPVQPLSEADYRSGISVIDDYDLFTPFKDNPDKWCKNASLFSPKPLGETLDLNRIVNEVAWGLLPGGDATLLKLAARG
ncbi:Imm49 family immunity protein [Thalassolituus sp. LLYu03]|uniref:Imm49 family immunity protein n=1 Tax=Thalassolituus sp. LLYu03 TaxID=3421656 RepID=UPI003D274749